MYSGTVIINGRTWDVEIATTSSERTQGLSGRRSLDADHGMLFDMGGVVREIDINVSDMNFPLDIMFFSEDGVVQAALWSQYPQDELIPCTFPSGPGARFFLEVNEFEGADVRHGDSVVITGYTPATPITTSSIFDLMITMMIVTMMMKMMMSAMKEIK